MIKTRKEINLNFPILCLDSGGHYRKHKYTPDILVQRKNKRQLIEVKPYDKFKKIIEDDQWMIKFKAAANYCKNNEFSEFLVVTEKELRDGALLKNVKYLFSYHKLKVPSSIKLRIRNEIIGHGPLQISQLLERICDNENTAVYYSYLLSMLYRHEISTDLSISLNRDSIVWQNH